MWMIQIRQTHLTDKWADKRQISAKEANFFRNSNCQIFKLDSGGSTLQNYVWIPDEDGWLLWEEARLWSHKDHVVLVKGNGGVKHFHPGGKTLSNENPI